MSTQRTIATPDGDAHASEVLHVARYSMGHRGVGLQLTIDDGYVQLAPERRLELYAVLGELFGTPPPAVMSRVVDSVFEYAEAHHEVLGLLERLERDPGTHPLATDDATTLIRAYQQAKQLHERIGRVMQGEPPPEPTGPSLSRQEVIAHLAETDSGADTRGWLCEQLDITDDDLAPLWWQLTLSRGALAELREIWTNTLGQFAFSDELTKAFANARPEEEE